MEKVIKILFICHGNICRSPLCESYFTWLAAQAGLSDRFEIASAATSREEIGNPPHRGTARVLKEHGIPLVPHRARRLTAADAEYYDLLIGMDEENIRWMKRITDGRYTEKMHMLLEFCSYESKRTPYGAAASPEGPVAERGNVGSSAPREVADPWYTGNFDETYRDAVLGCAALLEYCSRLY